MALRVGSVSMGDGACCHVSCVKVFGGQGRSLGWNPGQQWFCGTGHSAGGSEGQRQDNLRETPEGRLTDVYMMNSDWRVHGPSQGMYS